jgi:hypothetical protein
MCTRIFENEGLIQLRCLAQELGNEKTDMMERKGFHCCKYGRKGTNLTVDYIIPYNLVFDSRRYQIF